MSDERSGVEQRVEEARRQLGEPASADRKAEETRGQRARAALERHVERAGAVSEADPTVVAGLRAWAREERVERELAQAHRALDGAQRELARSAMSMAVLADVLEDLPEGERERAVRAIRATELGEHSRDMWGLLLAAVETVSRARPLVRLADDPGVVVRAKDLVTAVAIQVSYRDDTAPGWTFARIPLEGHPNPDAQMRRAYAMATLLNELAEHVAPYLNELDAEDAAAVADRLEDSAEAAAG